MMRDAPGRRLMVNGSEIYLEESGSGDTCVVLESGNGSGRTLWDPVVPLLRDIAHTVAYDRAGRGRSSRAEPPQSLDDMAATLAALVEALAPSRVILAGHSMGGLVVRRAAEKLSPRPAGSSWSTPPRTRPRSTRTGQRRRPRPIAFSPSSRRPPDAGRSCARLPGPTAACSPLIPTTPCWPRISPPRASPRPGAS